MTERPQNQTIVQASTAVVFRQIKHAEPQVLPEILMVQRSKALSFAGSASVFPGGKVHPSDQQLAVNQQQYEAVEAEARIAAIREVLEETGLVIGVAQRPSADEALAARAMLAENEDMAPVLERFSWTLDLGQLVPFARWLPKFKEGRVFDTRFYLANLGSGQVKLSPDFGENTKLFWTSAQQALTMIEQGKIKAIYPTRRNLERLAQFANFDEAADHANNTPIVTISPWAEDHGGCKMLCIPEGAGYPITRAPSSQVKIAG